MSFRVLALVVFLAGCSVGWVTDATADGLAEMAQRFYRMGRDALNNRDWPECIEHFTQVVEIDDEFFDAYMDLGFCQEQMEQFADAVDTYKEALDIASDDRQPEILSRMAWAQATGGQLDEAVESYLLLVKKTPEDKVAWEGLAYTYKNLVRYPESIMAYERALELDPSDINLYRTLGELCEQGQMLEQGARFYQKWMELEPQNVEPARRLAYIYAGLKACDKGVRLYNRVIELDPSNPGDLLNLGFLLQQCGRQAEALEVFERYRLLRPNDPTVDCRVVFLYEDVGDYNQGIQAAQSSLDNYPGDPCILFGYGRLLDKKGNVLVEQKKFDEAVAVFQAGMAKFQKVLGDETYGPNGQKQINRLEQLINRTGKLKQQAEEGY